jgi:hypothetical protein
MKPLVGFHEWYGGETPPSQNVVPTHSSFACDVVAVVPVSMYGPAELFVAVLSTGLLLIPEYSQT